MNYDLGTNIRIVVHEDDLSISIWEEDTNEDGLPAIIALSPKQTKALAQILQAFADRIPQDEYIKLSEEDQDD